MRLGATSLGEPKRLESDLVGGYQPLRRIGRGGAGEVWEAEGPGRFRVALKIISLDEQLGVRERRALEILRSIRHPHLVVSFGSWIVEDSLVIAMELADGTLWDRFGEARSRGLAGIPRGDLIGHLADAAEGIDFLNEPRHRIDGRPSMSVQHRDVKPQNLLVFGDGVKVADLGMARLLDRTAVDHTGSWSCAYAAPEFFENRTTRWSDQYSLAVTYCQLRTGRLPHAGSLAEMVLGHITGEPDLDALPEPEREVLRRALSRKPDRRWPNCRAFVEALRACELSADRLPGSSSGEHGLNVEDLDREVYGLGDEDLDRESASEPGWSSDSVGLSEVYWLGELGVDGLPDDAFLMTPPIASLSVTGPELASDSAIRPVATPNSGRRPGIGPSSGEVTLVDRERDVARPVEPAGPSRAAQPSVPTGMRTENPARSRPGRRRSRVPAGLAIVAFVGVGLVIWTGPDGPDQAAPKPEILGPTPPIRVPEFVRTSADDPRADLALQVAPDPTPDLGPVLEVPASETATESVASGSEIVVEPAPRSGPNWFESWTVADEPVEDSPPPMEPDLPRLPGSAWFESIGLTANANPPEPPDDATAKRPAIEPESPIDPADSPPAEAANGRGLDAYREGRIEEALSRFNEALDLDPNHIHALENRGTVRSRGGQYAEAISDFDAVLRLDPSNLVAFSNRGFARRALGDYEEAVADYRDALRIDPENPTLHYNLGIALGLSGEDQAALSAFNEAIRLNPDYARAYSARADLRARLGDSDGSAVDNARARELRAGDVAAETVP